MTVVRYEATQAGQPEAYLKYVEDWTACGNEVDDVSVKRLLSREEVNMSWNYSDKVKEHFMHPKNILEDENSFASDGTGSVGSSKCGDMMMLYIKVDKEKQIITDCRWKTYGCASAIASTSVLSEMVKGMSLSKAFNIKPEDIMKELDGLPVHKIHCSVLGDKALREAINDYYRKNGMEEKIGKEQDRVICTCLHITENDIKDAILEGARSFEDLQQRTKISTVCGKCEPEARAYLEKFSASLSQGKVL